jgi:Na+/H+-dicarboxylate symporter
MLVCVRWVLLLMPLGVFIFTFRFALASGDDAVEFLGVYVAIVCGLMLLCTALLYPVTALLGRTGVRDFARAVAPAQLIAVTTRSSIASLPALIQGARDRLRLPDSATGLVLPLSVSVFKLDISVSNIVKLVFLAHVYGVRLSAATLATFLVFVMVLSFSSPGLPSGGTFRALPAYLAAGVPIEGVVMVHAVEAIPDVFMTLLNVTADMSAATLLSRSSRAPGERARARDESRAASGEAAGR